MNRQLNQLNVEPGQLIAVSSHENLIVKKWRKETYVFQALITNKNSFKNINGLKWCRNSKKKLRSLHSFFFLLKILGK